MLPCFYFFIFIIISTAECFCNMKVGTNDVRAVGRLELERRKFHTCFKMHCVRLAKTAWHMIMKKRL